MILWMMLACGGTQPYEVEGLVTVHPPLGSECEEMEIGGAEIPQPAALVILGVWPGEIGREVICGTDTAVFAAGRLDVVRGPSADSRLVASQGLYVAAFDATTAASPLAGSVSGCKTTGETQDFLVVGTAYRRSLWLCMKGEHLYFVGYSSRTEYYNVDAAHSWAAGVRFD